MKLDTVIVERTQDAYLWVYDRTGIYVATVGMTSTVSAAALLTLANGRVEPLMLLGLAMNGLLCAGRYWLQNADKYEVFNAVSRNYRDHTGRIFMWWMWFAIIVMNVVAQSWLELLSAMLNWFFFCYLLCWQIRKREPPEKLVFAPQASGS